MKTIYQKLQQLSGLVGTKSLTAWESKFVEDNLSRAPKGDTRGLSGKVLEVIESLYEKHFEGETHARH